MNHGGLGLQLLVEICSQKSRPAKKSSDFIRAEILGSFKGGKISESIFIFVPFEEQICTKSLFIKKHD